MTTDELRDLIAALERRVVCENRGTGIGAILAALRQAGMGPPQFENQISTFRATFPNPTLLDEETLRWLARAGGFELTDSQRMGLALARHGDLLTNDSYRRFTDVDSRVATRELRELVRRDLLVQEGSHRWTTYRIKPEPPPSVQRGSRTGRTSADRRPAILALLAEHGELSRAEIADHLSLSDGNTRKWLGILIDEGAIEPTSPARSKRRSYRLKAAAPENQG